MSLEGTDPEWLVSLGGDFPLLGRSEWEFISEVRRRIIKEAKSRPGFHCVQPMKDKLCTMKDNFEKIVTYLKENSSSKEYFMCVYPEWRTVRNLTISQLKKLAECVNTDSQNCSVSRGVGSTVSLIGGLMCLAGGSGASRTLGGVLIGLGSATSAGACSVEHNLLRKNVKEAEKIIKEDREYSKKLWSWVSDVSYIQEALDNIRSIDIDINFKKAANEFHTCHKKRSGLKELCQNVMKVVKMFGVSPQIVNDISDVIGILIATSMLYDRYRHYFNVALETYKCNRALNTACGMIVASLKVVSAVNISKSSELTTFQKSRIFTGMALDAISIISAADGANSTSKEAKEIDKAAEKLKEEAEIFKGLYDAVNWL